MHSENVKGDHKRKISLSCMRRRKYFFIGRERKNVLTCVPDFFHSLVVFWNADSLSHCAIGSIVKKVPSSTAVASVAPKAHI